MLVKDLIMKVEDLEPHKLQIVFNSLKQSIVQSKLMIKKQKKSKSTQNMNKTHLSLMFSLNLSRNKWVSQCKKL